MSDEPMTEVLAAIRGLEIADSVSAEFSDFLSRFDRAAAWDASMAAFGEYLADNPDLGGEIAARIDRCLVDGRPASFLRLGDGEGNLLALALDEYPALTEHCARADSLLHFGATEVLLGAAPEVLRPFHTALRNSDLIGFPGPFGVGTILGRSATRFRQVQGLACVQLYLTRFANDLALRSKTGAPSDFHRGLLPHYETLVSGRRIGIVTCHPDLAQGLRARMGAKAVDLRLVPPQAVIAGSPPADTGHWPGRFRELIEELRTIEPGMLWFVAAGMLGKVYCDVIRTAGGIAVDVGHTADVWAGVRSRTYIEPATLATWRIV